MAEGLLQSPIAVSVTSSAYGQEGSLVISSSGRVLGNSAESMLRHVVAPGITCTTRVPRSKAVPAVAECNTNCGDSFCCCVYQVSGSTEPSQFVPGITLKFTNLADADRLHKRASAAQTPAEVSREGTSCRSYLEVGRSFSPNCKLFTSPYPESLSEHYKQQICCTDY